MPELTVGTSSGNKTVTDPWIGTDAGNRQVQEMWVGTPGGNRLVFNRSQPVVLTATPASTSAINLSWTAAADGATYTLLRNATTIFTGPGLSKQDTGLAPNSTYGYRVIAKLGNVTLSEDTAQATTMAPSYQQKVVTLNPSSGGSYYGNGSQRSGIGASYYSGNYTFGSNGRQASALHFPVPADVRWCRSVDKVEFAIQNDHTYNGGGVTQYIALSAVEFAGGTLPGSSGLFAARATARDGWWGGSQWQDITNLGVPPQGVVVSEWFRTGGAFGIHLKAPDDNINYYSYWRPGGCQLRITYTVETG
jgi:hypothetical protein